jgi:hypothetical protein
VAVDMQGRKGKHTILGQKASRKPTRTMQQFLGRIHNLNTLGFRVPALTQKIRCREADDAASEYHSRHSARLLESVCGRRGNEGYKRSGQVEDSFIRVLRRLVACTWTIWKAGSHRMMLVLPRRKHHTMDNLRCVVTSESRDAGYL